jgi:hypothetical protein
MKTFRGLTLGKALADGFAARVAGNPGNDASTRPFWISCASASGRCGFFSFDVQGHEFKDFDIWKKAGGPNKAYVQSVDVEVTGGKLDITFTPQVENPKINGIEILPRS